jgi:hypothetical protein
VLKCSLISVRPPKPHNIILGMAATVSIEYNSPYVTRCCPRVRELRLAHGPVALLRTGKAGC